MNRDTLSYIGFGLLIIFVITVQTALFSQPIPWIGNIQLVVLTTIFFIMYDKYIYALIMAGVGGYFIDFYSILPFGIITGASIAAFIMMILFHEYVFKNRALHAFFINGVMATVAYFGAIMLGIWMSQRIANESSIEIDFSAYALETGLYHIVSHGIAIILVYYVVQYGSRFLKQFIVRRR